MEVSSDEDDDVIGPRPPRPEEEIDVKDALAMQFEERAKKMKEKIEGKNEEGIPKRETRWVAGHLNTGHCNKIHFFLFWPPVL